MFRQVTPFTFKEIILNSFRNTKWVGHLSWAVCFVSRLEQGNEKSGELEGAGERKSPLKVPLPSGSRMARSEAPARSKPLRRSIECGAAGALAFNTEIHAF